jgi:glycosyltransferase involved in cell wall biosynthesis
MTKSIFDLTGTEARERLKKAPVRIAVLHMAHEGLMIRTGGVGAVVQGHLSATPVLAEALARRGIQVSLFAAQPVAKPGCEGWNPQVREYTEAQVARTGGAFQPILNGTDGTVRWGEIENWQIASAAGASWALGIAAKFDAAIVYSHSLPFSLTPVYGLRAAEAFGADVFFVQMEHGHYEKPELSRPDDPWRLAYGRILPLYRQFSHVRLGWIGQYIRELAAGDYGLAESDFVPARNGIDPTAKVFRLRSEDEKRRKLAEYGIPLDRPIVFSWGRPEIWKGHHWVAEAAPALAARAETVVMTSPDWPFLREANAKAGGKARLIFKFDTELVAALLQWKNTRVAALVSQGEPFGLTPLEARVNARRGGPVVVVSDTGGMTPQVIDGVDGFHVKTGDVQDMVRVFGRALDLPEDKAAAFRAAGLQGVLKDYTWASNILETWSAVCPLIRAVADEVREEVRIREV